MRMAGIASSNCRRENMKFPQLHLGFEEVHAPKVRVEVGVETTVALALSKVKGQREHVEVTESVPLVETAKTTLSQIVDRQLVQELPLNGRDFGKLVALTPGVTVEGRAWRARKRVLANSISTGIATAPTTTIWMARTTTILSSTIRR